MAGRSMDEDDSSSILESSLFFSCMSSSPPDEDVRTEHGDGACGSGNDGTDRAKDPPAAVHRESTQPVTDISASDGRANGSSQLQDKHPTPTAADATVQALAPAPVQIRPPAPPAVEARVSNSSSNSSWSVIPEKERPVVRSITFNRDRTCLIISTNIGVRIRTLESLSLQNLHYDASNQQSWIFDVPLPPDGATYAQLLHSSSLLAVVKPSSPRCCFLYNAKNTTSPLAALPLSAAVKRVELNKRCLAAMTVDLRLHVFHMTEGGGAADKLPFRPTLVTTLNVMHPSDSPRNVTRGLDGYNAGSYFDLCPKEEEPLLVCKSFNGGPGTVRVYDPSIVSTISTNVASDASARSGKSAASTASSWDKYNSPPETKKVKRRIQLLTTITAHENACTRMLIGGGGKEKQTFLATVSAKGTTIRVFGLPKGDQMWEWHRGSKPCTFYSISWNGTAADRLATFGSSGTIHVFDWAKKKQKAGPSESAEEHEMDTANGFQRVDDKALQRSADDHATPVTASSTPFLRRIGSTIKRRAERNNNPANPVKNRSAVKMKWRPSVLPTVSPGSSAKSQSLVLALLDRNQSEDRLVVCSMEGEMRQYSVKADKSIGLIQVEDALARK
ncbi:hypothetical protein ACHAXT_009959 [Thalassiosira profunda]